MRTRLHLVLLLIVCIGYSGISFSQNNSFIGKVLPKEGIRWVDSVYNSLSLDEQIGQLIMIKATSDGNDATYYHVEEAIRNNKVGGICFFKGKPLSQAQLTNNYQALSKVPLLISMDAEWGLGMRLGSNAMSFPRQMTLGAIADTQYIYIAAERMAKQLRRLGVQVSFAPVADINSNPANPIINIRSFGENKVDVSEKSLIYMRALSNNGIMSVAKHFPGHGDTDIDSHHALPVISHNKETLDTLDLYPFKSLISHNIEGIMVGHINLPAIDTTKNVPASLSKNVIQGILRNELGFNGIVFTDALDMRSVSSFALPGKVEIEALLAGNDVLLFPENTENAIRAIRMAIDSNLIPRQQIEEKCKRILSMKFKLGLTKVPEVNLEGLETDISSPADDYLIRKMYEAAVTIVKNEGDIVPVKEVAAKKMASLFIGNTLPTIFQERMSCYAPVDHYYLPVKPSAKNIEQITAALKIYDLVFIALGSTNASPGKNFGIEPGVVNLVDALCQTKKVILNLFTVPYAINLFKYAGKAKAILVAYQDNPLTYDITAQVLFGAIGAKGRLPVSVSKEFPIHTGIITSSLNRLKFTQPEEVGMSSYNFTKVDSLVLDGIRQKAYPGAQVLIAIKGNVIYQKAYGFHDYTEKLPVLNSDIYDLASVTKVTATTPSVMKLFDKGLIQLDKPLSEYYTPLKNSNKSLVTVREVMTHQAGFVSWIPFYRLTLKGNKADSSIYRKVYSEAFPVKVADQLFERRDIPGWMLDSVVKSPVSEKKEYKYSDLSFILTAKAVQQLSGKPVDEYVLNEFYRPLGLSNIGFNPWKRYPLKRIAPTENDTVFRKQLLTGYVHDEGAAMFGGVAGHAGLFSNAGDLAVVYQMLLNNGTYGGRSYVDSATVKLFTSYQFPGSRRGLGYDKPQLDRTSDGPACPDASSQSFGHTGFTGTYVWADPEYKLLIIFLTNRVNPDAQNNKLSQRNYRTNLQQTLYDIILRPPIPVPVFLKPVSQMKNIVAKGAVVKKNPIKHKKIVKKHTKKRRR